MSRAVPSSYSEYLFTDSTDLICDGGIMPLRNSSDPTSTWYKKCLRGEDLIFFNEALNVRSKAGGSSWVRTPSTQISSGRMAEFKTSVGSMVNSFAPSLSALPQAADITNSSLDDYIKSFFNPVTQYSSGDAYTVLDSAQVLNLFKDIKQLNYAISRSSRGGLCPYNSSYACTYTVHEEDNRPWTTPPADYDQTTTSYLWYEGEDTSWAKNQGYPSDVETHLTSTVNSSSITFTERTSSPPNLYKTCVEIIPYASLDVCNSGVTYSTDGGSAHGGDSIYEYRYVCVPLKSSFTDMLNGGVISLTSTEVDDAISLAFSTVGLQKKAVDIALTPATGDYTNRSTLSTCKLSSIVYLVHFKYCSLESVTIQ